MVYVGRAGRRRQEEERKYEIDGSIERNEDDGRYSCSTRQGIYTPTTGGIQPSRQVKERGKKN